MIHATRNNSKARPNRKEVVAGANKMGRLLNEVRETNLSYLMLAKQMILEDKPEAIYRLGINEELADLLTSLSTAQILKIAASSVLMCRFRFDDQMIWDLITNHDHQHDMSGAHAAILMTRKQAKKISVSTLASGKG
jgi:flagellar transcriptional activator FlhD